MMKAAVFIFLSGILVAFASKSDRVKLTDISVLTLYEGRSTTGRRSSPVPQTKCIGGTAQGKFIPKVVQCYNRGSDGYDVQWECKSDMDNDYRFASVEVVCEGYDYPDDPYILRGSCGLEYTLDLTKQGWEKKNAGSGSNYGYGSGNTQNNQQQHYSTKTKDGIKMADLVFFAVVGLFIYTLYKMCIDTGHAGDGNYGPDGRRPGNDDDDYRRRGGNDDDASRRRGNPPPPGFRSDYGGDDTCSGSANNSQQHYNNNNQQQHRGANNANAGANDGPGFWTGMMGGGLLGYLFGGNRGYGGGGYGGYGGGYGYPRQRGWFGNGWGGDDYYDDYGTGYGLGGGHTYTQHHYGNNGGSPFGGGGGGGGFFGGGGGGFGSGGGGGGGTRTASGFGGTRRR